jgi:RNA polymerase sigma-70 factor (ECF subfamily)
MSGMELAVVRGQPVQRIDSTEAFGEWVAPHVPAMTRLAGRLVPAADRDDVVQEALVRAWRRRSTYDGTRGTPQAWLLAIVTNCARRAWARAPRDVPMELRDTSGQLEPADVDMERAIRTLTERERLAVSLYYFVGLDVAATAAVMACSAGTVKATLHHARARLRFALGERDE